MRLIPKTNFNMLKHIISYRESLVKEGKMIESKKEKAAESIKNLIFEKAKENEVVLSRMGNLVSVDIDTLIFNQPVEGLLYDLNRLEEVVATFIDDPKWINDYAVAKVIRRMRQRIDELEDELEKDKFLDCEHRAGDVCRYHDDE